MHASDFTVLPFFDISAICAKYLACNPGSVTEMITNIILANDVIEGIKGKWKTRLT